MRRIGWLIALACCVASPARADDDKSREADIFSDEESEPQPKPPGTPGAVPPVGPPGIATPSQGEPAAGDFGDERMRGEVRENTELLTRDRTQIGGFFYSRSLASLGEGQPLEDVGFSQSILFDTYFDSRVNDRVRAYARGRLVYDANADVPQAFGFSGTPTQRDEARASLTQLWLKFDVKQAAFLTVGRQFVRWGATRLWNPVDVLNTTRFNPFTFFDERVGVPMVKLHVPVEALGWNFYAIALTDDALTLGRAGLAGRAELVFGSVELGLLGLAKKGQDPKLGADISAGVLDFDVTGELGVWFPDECGKQQPGADCGDHPHWQASAGVSYTWPFGEDDSLIFGIEYFHNPQGLTEDEAYESLKAQALLQAGLPISSPAPRPMVPLYTGRNYVGGLATLISPGSWNDTTFSAIGLSNLSDGSASLQLSMSTRVLTDLGVEVYTGVAFGDGELRGYLPMLKDRVPQEPLFQSLPDSVKQPIQAGLDRLVAPLFRAGLNLRVDL